MSVFMQLENHERDSGQLAPHRLWEAFETFQEQGCLILQNVLAPDYVARLARAFDAQIAGFDPETLWNRSLQVGPRRLIMPLPLKGEFGEPAFYAQPLICQLCEKLMEPQFVLGSCSVVVAFPGATAQRNHRDNNLLFGDSRASLMIPTYAITVGIPLIPLTAATGTTAMYAKSHQELLDARIYAEPAIEPRMRLGDAYLFDSRLVHNGTPNASELWRPIIYLTYARNWFLDVENYLQNNTNAVIADAETLRRVPASRPQLLNRARLKISGAAD